MKKEDTIKELYEITEKLRKIIEQNSKKGYHLGLVRAYNILCEYIKLKEESLKFMPKQSKEAW